MRWPILLLSLFLPLIAAASEPVVVTMRIPGGGLAPQVAVDAAGETHMVYFKRGKSLGDIYYTHTTGGNAFGKAIRVNSQPGCATLFMGIGGAHLALGNGGAVHVAWVGAKGARPTGPNGEQPLLYARMLPGAGTFEPQRNVIRTRYGVGAGSSIAADDKGNVYIFWHAGARGMASLSGPGIRRVYVARSGDEGKTFAQENALFEKPRAFGACICCTLRAGVDAQGQVYVVFRGATATDRNSYLVVSRNHASSFVLVLTHPMPTRARACPESRAAIAIGDGGVYAAWRTKRKVYVSHLESGTSKASWTASAPESTQFQKSPSLATNARGE